MIEGLFGLLSAWAVFHLFRHTRAWPWRVADLQVTQAEQPVRPPQIRSSPQRVTQRSRHSQRQIQSEIPAAVDLLHLAVSAGHSLHTAVAAVADLAGSGTGLVTEALAEVQQRFERGGQLTEELAKLPTLLGPSLQPLSTTLIVAASSGAPLGPSLQRLADAERRRLRRQTEERVRRLPVLLLAPLITLVLPAFVLLTVVPVAITTAKTGLAPLNASPQQIQPQQIQPQQNQPQQNQPQQNFPPSDSNLFGPP
ncbi:MAG: type II secretion system F family protein [Microthrixaceae bacterium]